MLQLLNEIKYSFLSKQKVYSVDEEKAPKQMATDG